MATTLDMIDATVARLRAKLPALAVEYFPEDPDTYRLNHPKGALLVTYAGSDFGATADITHVMQPRLVKLSVTVILRQLNGRGGAIDVLDLVRRAMVGFRPPDCRKVRALGEHFLGNKAGLWQYAVDFAAEAMQVEDAEPESGPLLTNTTYEEQT